ncbi:iron complex transport system substrate-binding protein [Kibdelosporangium banguiense]|uniref:Iron complex transport system substrate-binding protein n=1 Tax=Kibdelosporangium banguiense TaxID=1365924 RepID=A0ABS4TPV4_9PSEU|nr:ABC transporter substrate-binding protein [Kibdelosporangium banguiense]MBP2326436.1 iron complex transport system substrate-binding protein [Kibdelosporangium banguiense]
MLLRRRTFLAAIGAAALASSGCGPGTQSPAPGPGATKPVTHPYGKSEVPISPKRVIALDPGQALQIALEHGIPLVASATLDANPPVPPYLPAPAHPFEHLGFGQVDIEKLATFGPDLIIGNTASLQDKYPAVSGLAPTVAYANTRDKVEWYDAALTVADIFGVRDAQQRKLDEYRARASEFRERNKQVLTTRKVALLRFTTDELRIITDSVIFPSRVLTDAGVQRTASSAPAKAGDTYTRLSPEQVGVLADADVIIHFTGGGAFEGGQVTSTFVKYTSGDLWKRLPAVQGGKVFEVPRTSWWDGGSTSAASAMLADLDQIMPKLG